MRGAAALLGVLLLAIVLPTPSSAPHAGDISSTRIGNGMFHDLEIDTARGQVYTADSPNWGDVQEGVGVFNLGSHLETQRVNTNADSAVILSPSGGTLAVGFHGGVTLVDPDTLQVTDRIYLTEDGSYSASVWDIAFYGEGVLVASLEANPGVIKGFITGPLIVDLATKAESTRIDKVFGVAPGAGVEVDIDDSLLYLLEGGQVTVFDLTQTPPAELRQTQDPGMTGHGLLSADGGRLYFSSGMVFRTDTLQPIDNLGTTGDLFLDEVRGIAYFTDGGRIDRVTLGTGTMQRFQFTMPPSGWGNAGVVCRIAVDTAREIAYVISGDSGNSNDLHAIALVPAFLNPMPWAGSAVPYDVYSVSVVPTAIDPASVEMIVDGTPVTPTFDPLYYQVYYNPPTPWTGGEHRTIVTGRDASGALHTFEWTFTIDMDVPQIYLDNPRAVYRTAVVEVPGHVVDASPVELVANGRPVVVDPVTGAFAVPMTLEEGGNSLVLEAWDAPYNRNYSRASVLYVPPTTRYVDEDGGFSFEYPTAWTAETDVVSGGVRADILVTATSLVTANVITSSNVTDATPSGLRAAADEVLDGLSRLPGFSRHDAPQELDIPGLVAVTYSFSWDSPSGPVYQRQVIVAAPQPGRAWVLTFTAPASGRTAYDPLFLWMAESLEPTRTGVDASMLLLLLSLALIGAGFAVVAAFLLRRSRAARTPAPGGEPAVSNPASTECPPAPEARPPEPPDG